MIKKAKAISSANTEIRQHLENYLKEADGIYMPGVSVNIVVFNYRNGKLNVLIMRFAETRLFMLPGGYVMKDEDLDNAALRIFNEWTGLQNSYLEQFYTSGKADRNSEHLISDMFQQTNKLVSDPWFDQRKISVCYFALLNEPEINPVKVDFFVSEYRWMNISDIPPLLFDHNHIIRKAIQKVQDDLDHIIVARPLFKEEFTMHELQKLYEAIYQKTFTRTNFQRRMLNLDILERIGKHFTGKAHKAPYLYRFRKDARS